MDRPFFTTAPHPADRLYTLTHVRYTPHRSWIEIMTGPSAYEIAAGLKPESRARRRLLDPRRSLPCLHAARHGTAFHDVKSVLPKNERDRRRPLLFPRKPARSRSPSIRGGTTDNIHDLFPLLKQEGPEWSGAQDRAVLAREAAGDRP